MPKNRKVITLELHRKVLIRSRRKSLVASLVAWCETCGMETLMLIPEQAAVVSGATQREIFRQIENGELHFIEANEGALFICSNSLELPQPH
jgi:hypothetical protein